MSDEDEKVPPIGADGVCNGCGSVVVYGGHHEGCVVTASEMEPPQGGVEPAGDAVRGVDPDRPDRPGPQVVGQGSTPTPEITVRTVKAADVPERAVRAYAEHRERLAELLTPEALARFDEAERRLDEQALGIPPVDGSDG